MAVAGCPTRHITPSVYVAVWKGDIIELDSMPTGRLSLVDARNAARKSIMKTRADNIRRQMDYYYDYNEDLYTAV
jgi:hypothetical protein